MTAEIYKKRARNGRYAYEGQWQRVCRVCGNTLGQHLAEAPHPIIDGEDAAEQFGANGKNCPGFRPVRKKGEKK